jgi:hypothetical protein
LSMSKRGEATVISRCEDWRPFPHYSLIVGEIDTEPLMDN